MRFLVTSPTAFSVPLITCLFTCSPFQVIFPSFLCPPFHRSPRFLPFPYLFFLPFTYRCVSYLLHSPAGHPKLPSHLFNTVALLYLLPSCLPSILQTVTFPLSLPYSPVRHLSCIPLRHTTLPPLPSPSFRFVTSCLPRPPFAPSTPQPPSRVI